MKNIIKLLIRLVCMVCLTFMAVHTACAQSDEFATWTGVKLNYKVTSRWNLSGAAEFEKPSEGSRSCKSEFGGWLQYIVFLKVGRTV